MRDQYAGDITDLIKFSLLRALAGEDRRLGVAWYYAVGDDNKHDGRHREWVNEAHWSSFDPSVHLDLANLPVREIKALQQCRFWPQGTQFHAEPLPALSYRSAWLESKRIALDGCDLVFLDPDNGLGRATRKHATLAEIHALRDSKRTIVLISFPHRNNTHMAQLLELQTRITREAGARRVVTLRTNVSVPTTSGSTRLVQRQRWFTLVDSDDVLDSRLYHFQQRLSSLPRTRAHVDYGGVKI